MQRALGRFESNELLLASTLQHLEGASIPTKKLPFISLYSFLLDQALCIDVVNKQTAKETRRLHEAETRTPFIGHANRGGRGFGRGGHDHGRGSGVPYLAPDK